MTEHSAVGPATAAQHALANNDTNSYSSTLFGKYSSVLFLAYCITLGPLNVFLQPLSKYTLCFLLHLVLACECHETAALHVHFISRQLTVQTTVCLCMWMFSIVLSLQRTIVDNCIDRSTNTVFTQYSCFKLASRLFHKKNVFMDMLSSYNKPFLYIKSVSGSWNKLINIFWEHWDN